MKYDWSLWLHDLMAAAILGFSNAILTFLGIASLDEIGVKIMRLDFKQTLMVICAGAISGLAAYLKKHPAPDRIKTNEKPTDPPAPVQPPAG